MTDIIYLCLGIALGLGIWGLRNRLSNFPAQKPSDYADDYTNLDMKKYLDGDMICEGVIYGPSGRVSSQFVADFIVEWDGDTAVINEHFVYDDNTTQHRVWTITMGENGAFTATAPDVPGIGRGKQSGGTIQMRYPIKLPADVGGHTLQTVDWIYLTPNGTLINRSQFRKFGIRVAELVATIRKKDT